jgi:predicted branched-subunit amino acid permease
MAAEPPSPPELASPSIAAAEGSAIPGSPFLAGMRRGATSIFAVTMIANYVGIGTLSNELGLPLVWTLIASVLIWAAPAHVILASGLATKAALAEIAIAVALSGVRLLPMTITLLPLLRAARTRQRDLLLPAHFTAISTWVEGIRLLPQIRREQRIAFLNGIGTALGLYAFGGALVGYVLSASLPFALAAALLFTTPMAFLLSLIKSARGIIDQAALPLGLILGPTLAASGIGIDLVWTGLIGGSIAYALHRWRARQA